MALKPLLCCALLACAPVRDANVLRAAFMGTDGAWHSLVDPRAPFTVVEFFSAHCLCQAQHDARLNALLASYRSRGVAFVAVDSERGAALSRDRLEAVRRGYSHSILIDPDGRVARAMNADYATYSLLLDRSGQVLYRGGIDSDRTHLNGDAVFYLQNAIDDALAQRSIQMPEARTLGCSLALE